MLIATAGHVDHGKTSLIRALTGIETDRLPEEQARGISIDLGFAYWQPAGGRHIGFVDVPGHERYVRTMLAGVSGVDFALLVVAADDGVMPQTLEHLRILDLLGICQGLVVITKCDKASAERIAAVRGELANQLAGTSLAGAPMLEVSSTTGTGIDQLSAALARASMERPEMPRDNRGVRLAIDRVFTVTGAGTVVTGTVIAGAVSANAELALAPLGRTVRVRGVQSGGVKADSVRAGQRCALNLSGIDVGDVHRGDWLVELALHAPTCRIEARIGLLAQAATLRHDTAVHLHIGAADLAARVLIPRQRSLQPGEAALVQLVLDRPTSAVTGERFILRDQSGKVLLGGGQVLDPLPGKRRRTEAQRQAMAAALAFADPAQALAALAAVPGLDCDSGWFARCFNLPAAALSQVLAAGDFVQYGENAALIVTKERFDRLADSLVAALGLYHSAKPDAGGITRRDLRTALAEPVSRELLAALLHDLSAADRLRADGALVRLPEHTPSFSAAETVMWRNVLAAHEDRPPHPIIIAELAREMRSSDAAITAMLARRRISGDVWQVTDSKYMLRDHVAALVATAAQLDGETSCGFSAAQFRDASGLGRNFVIQLLEFFDRIGVTRRLGEARRMRGDYQAVVGGE